MNATAVAVPAAGHRSWAQSTRAALVALVIVVLFAVSFVLGRATGSTNAGTTKPAPAIARTAGVDAPLSCHVGRSC